MPAKANENAVGGGSASLDNGLRRFTRATLAGFDGHDPSLPVLIAYRGCVYDVTNCVLWQSGRHFSHPAGRDLTAALRQAPHGEQLLERAPCVGILDERTRSLMRVQILAHSSEMRAAQAAAEAIGQRPVLTKVSTEDKVGSRSRNFLQL